MKVWYLLFIVPLVFIACSKDSVSDNFTFGAEENLKIGNENKSAENNIQFTITNVQDSRCPGDVVCIWQGEAVVDIEFTKPFQQNIQLNTFDNLVDIVGNYTVKLLNVSPYPVSTQTIKTEDYTIKLRIDSILD